jgi:hypothetical protein
VEGLEVVQAKAGLKFNVRPDSGPLMELQQHMLFNEQQIKGEALEGLAIQVGSVQVRTLHLFVRQKFFSDLFLSVLGIRDILVRIRIRGSVSLVDPTPFFSDFKNAKKCHIFFL